MSVKNIFFYFVFFIVIYFLMEITSALVFYADKKTWPSFDRFTEQQKEIAQHKDYIPIKYQSEAGDPQIINPYLGFTFDPENKPWWAPFLDDYGFINEINPIQKKGADKIIVGIFGGSVAHQVSTGGAEALKEEIRKPPTFKNKDIQVLRFSIGGYKQPQALICLAYLISLGAHFDIIINIDGFNEITLPSIGNIPFNTFPFYPIYWHARIGPNHERNLKYADKLEFLKYSRRSLSQYILTSITGYSITINIIWNYIDAYIDNNINKIRRKILSTNDSARDFEKNGPSRIYNSDEELYSGLAANWSMSSIVMMHLSRSIDSEYFHILQPNQYVAGSKTLTDEERDIAYDLSSAYKVHVEKGYKHLIREGLNLINSGVNFYDMTQLYQGIEETVYQDTCCHFNEFGASVFGKEIGESIKEYFSQK